jgi:hypothetical protein
MSSADRTIEKLAETRFLLDEQDAHSADAIAFVHSVLSQIGLPRSPQKTREWVRTNGAASLRVVAGSICIRVEDGSAEWVEQSLPQGPYARLLLADISTYAVRHKTTVVPMEASAGAYMRNRLHLFPGGGKRGTYTSFKREAQALAAAHMELGVAYAGKVRNAGGRPIAEFEAWMVDDGPQQALWPCELVLSEQFFRSLRSHAAPIDMRAYRALAHSALAQDIYTWLAHRLPRLSSPLGLPWAVLAKQFGGYANAKRFREEFVKRLKEVRTVYPDARFEIVAGRRGESGGSLVLRQSRPPVYRVSEVVPGALGAPARMGEKVPMRPAALPPGCPE